MTCCNRITLRGQQLFLSGFSLAWIHFGGDVGDYPLDEPAFEGALRNISRAGGNTLRVWLSTNGSQDPVFDANGTVCGLGSRTIANVQKMLELAKRHNMLLMPVLLTHNFLQVHRGVDLDRNLKMLATAPGLAAYIEHAVTPLVVAIGDHPNLICWEIANEAEGMTFENGWTDRRISKLDVQILTNRIAGAIHRAVPTVLVSTGIVTAAQLDWYGDATLQSCGGDPQGVLDFYMIHYYGWNGPQNSPFHKPAAAWGMNKPIVVGEFPSSSWNPLTPSSSPMQDAENVDGLLANLYDNGYAGGLFWQYQRDGGDPWMLGFATAAPSITALAARRVGEGAG